MHGEIKQMLFRIKQYTIEAYYAAFDEIEQRLAEQEQMFWPKEEHREDIRELCEALTAELDGAPVWMKVHILSFCMKCSGNDYAERLTQEVLDASYEELGEYTKYFLFWQISAAEFNNINLQSIQAEKGKARLYKELYQAFYDALCVKGFQWIPIEKRNQDKVFVFTSQFLNETHAPTKTVCDRAYFLQKHMGKQVTVINTAMLVTKKGDAPFYGRKFGGYLPEYQNLQEFWYKGECFTFYQCENNMPDPETMQRLLRRVAEEKPYCIVQIGDGDICTDLCGAIVPVITVSTVPSNIAVSTGRFQVTDRDLQKQDYALLEILGVKPENMKKALFTYVFKEQKHHYERAEFNLKDDVFLLLVTGWRLAGEAQPDFLQMLDRIVSKEDGIEALFMGQFEGFEKTVSGYPHLKEKSHYLGFQEDALAVTECCDLYVNPKRRGGGTSSAEALYKGLPVVTLPYGDVSAVTGEAFHTETYEKMEEMILRYARDTAFYREMAKRAKERAADLLDSRTHFGNVFREIEEEPDFK